MGRKVDAKGTEQRRKQIVDAAFACFRKNGFHKSSMQQICKTAGLSPGTVYHYFSSKDEIITRFAELEVERAREFAQFLKTAPDLEGALAEAIDDILGSSEFDNSFQVYMEVVCEAGRNIDVGRLLLKAEGIVLKTLRAKIKQERFALPTVSTEVLAEYLGAQLEMLEMYKRYDPSPKKCRQMAVVCKTALSLLLSTSQNK